MNREKIIQHINRHYSTAPERANFLVEVVYHRRRLVSNETASAIVEILNQPICTGVIFGQLATKYHHIIAESQSSRRKIYSGRQNG